jgi:hypothetical protein
MQVRVRPSEAMGKDGQYYTHSRLNAGTRSFTNNLDREPNIRRHRTALGLRRQSEVIPWDASVVGDVCVATLSVRRRQAPVQRAQNQIFDVGGD